MIDFMDDLPKPRKKKEDATLPVLRMILEQLRIIAATLKQIRDEL